MVLSADAYAALTAPRPSFTEYLLSGPAWPDDMVAYTTLTLVTRNVADFAHAGVDVVNPWAA